MASIRQIRGALLEEIVLLLLERSGYRRVVLGEQGTLNGPAGLEVEGRGSSHQIDALVTPLHTHAFVYPIRLVVEAKCQGNPVGLGTVRSVVGTISDINQNYFAAPVRRGQAVRVQRFNYLAAMFASNGYSDNAERYALAHQVFLIDYSDVASMRPVVDALLDLEIADFGVQAEGGRQHGLTEIRGGFRALLHGQAVDYAAGIFLESGVVKVRASLVPSILQLRGSYYGMIEGLYPVHLISRQEIPAQFIREHGEIPCEIRVSDDDQTWAFEPSRIPRDSPEFFHLEFTIPEFVADMLNTRVEPEGEPAPHWQQVADIKRRYMRFIDVTAVLEGRIIGFRLTLDEDWLNRYVRRREAPARPRRDGTEPQG
jgi:Restriction endonuclease